MTRQPTRATPACGQPLAGLTISFDLWNTLIRQTALEASRTWQLERFGRILRSYGHRTPPEAIAVAVQHVRHEHITQQRLKGAQFAVEHLAQALLVSLGVAYDESLVEQLSTVWDHTMLHANPRPIDGAPAVLSAVRRLGARVVLTSNTLASTPATHLLLLADLDLLQHFDFVLLSGDLDTAKPSPDVFELAAGSPSMTERTVHIGDDVLTDVDGALAAGCRAVHYDPQGCRERPHVPAITQLTDLPELMTLIASTHA
ncbi:HAD family hydrolase [Kitasatospora sp. NPDC096147]|uniref:HAD family hydrolase n=1 Tax=Kitasatospora sp. NPDC096147 TaxID=3364093 RepID=UPI00381CA872